MKNVILFLLSALHITLEESKIDALVQFIKFCLVGVTNTLVSYGVNIFVLFLLEPYGLAWDYVAGNVVAFLLSVLWSFFWNNRLVFAVEEGRKRNILPALLKTYVAYGFTRILLNNALSYVWIEILGISKLVAPLINLIVSIPVNYLINKNWAFK